MPVAVKCSECDSPVPPRRRGTCSAPCKRIAKRSYDSDRYAANRAEKIAAVSAWQAANRERKRAYDAAYREATRDERLARKREWSRRFAAANPEASRHRQSARRARIGGAGSLRVIDRDLRRMLARYRNRCAACECTFTAANPVEWDHIIPIARGGRHSIGNLWPLCRRCNRNKLIRFVTEWRTGRTVCVRGRAA